LFLTYSGRYIMRVAVLSSFFVYTGLLGILQNIIAYRRGAANVPKKEYPRFNLYRLLSAILLLGGVLTMTHSALDNLIVVRLFGFVLISLGLVLSMWAQYELGKYWVGGIGLHKRHKLVTTGPYRYVRHPLYAGMWLSGIGICLVSLNILYGLAALMFAFAYTVRVPFEEHLLRQKFKQQYERYESETGGVIPHIRKRG
jgi:protein-S-isoprenylcysteine O-methyltransferase Ste14